MYGQFGRLSLWLHRVVRYRNVVIQSALSSTSMNELVYQAGHAILRFSRLDLEPVLFSQVLIPWD